MTVDWLSPAQVAERYEIPEATVRYWRHIGYGPAPAKLGRHIRYRATDWDAFVASLVEAEERKREVV
ncbi:MAG: helix-turn-helix transcriptional regulator [Nocardioidaceae bacterium]